MVNSLQAEDFLFFLFFSFFAAGGGGKDHLVKQTEALIIILPIK